MLFFENLHRFKKKIFNRKNFQLNDQINFGSKEANNFFEENLNKSKFYFEFGSGSSTLRADQINTRFISIELDKAFYNLVKSRLNKKNIQYAPMGPVGEFSYPIFKNKIKIQNYVNSIDRFFKKKDYPDFILIDGRFRVACCLNILRFFDILKLSNVIILIDDFEKRNHYKILNEYFNIKLVGRMGLLVSHKKNFDKKVFDKYLLDSR